ncbi:MAG: helix-turn-helix transcriptional regulator [Prolixibacteraceae bacterium]|nr:helix-turn-helix transcriptional regulator [Prolixibacteraceae bacterium]MBN2775849.1 helix-turn-helix transcriptional regulator [Prolixibacteraceae bacterium]
MKKIVLLIILIWLQFVKSALGFELKGKVDYANDWQPVIFLASLNSPADLFVASPDFILSKTIIGADGSFSFKDVVIPDEPMFYRLYMVKNEFSTVEFNTPENRNYIHLILDNQSELSVELSLINNKLDVVSIKDQGLNKSVFQFDDEILKYKKEMSADLSKNQLDLLKQQHDSYIKNFIDTCQNSMVGLYALYHIEEKETDFLRNSNFYINFKNRLHNEFPSAIYTSVYDDLLNSLVDFRDLVCEIPGVAPKWKDYLLILESALIVFLLTWILLKKTKLKATDSFKSETDIYFRLTEKEKQILKLISEGKTNKEISKLLFIELSTVKTHINNIYKQIKVPDRKGAAQFFKQLNLE